MDRRSFLTKTALGGSAVAATGLAAPALASGKRTLTMVTSVPDGFAIFDDAAQHFADLVGQMSDGALTIDKKPAGTLVGAFEVFDAVSAGQADMYHSAEYYFGGQHPGYYFFTGVPFGATTNEFIAWYEHGGGAELHDELGQIFGLKTFPCGNTGTQAGGWFRKEIKSAADLQGLRFRMPGLGGKALGLAGASVQSLPGGEIFQALSSGSLDGAEWIGPYADERMGFAEVCEYFYPAGFHEPTACLAASVNRDVFEGLTEGQQKIIETAAYATHQWSLSQSNAENGKALDRIRAAGIKVMSFPDDVWEVFSKSSTEALDEFMDDELYARIRASFEASIGSTSDWLSNAEATFVEKRNLIRG